MESTNGDMKQQVCGQQVANSTATLRLPEVMPKGKSRSFEEEGPFGIYGGVQNPSASGFNSLQDSTAVPPLWAQQSNSKSSSEPYIDSMTATNVTALVGKSAYLSCRVRNLGNKTVSWIRHRDIHILTVGSYTYTSDQRFQSTHHIKTSDWTLQIKWAQKRDAGIYECQISTQPVTSYFVHLIVVDNPDHVKEESTTGSPRSKDDDDVYQKMFADTVPSALVLGGPDLHYDKGSTINLTCEIRFSPEPPAYIFWYHEEDVISYDSSRGGVTVITEKGEETTSFLLIQHADISDSGKYSCSPSNADVASVRVHVLNGERPAAMQTGSAGLSNSCINMIFLLIVSYLYSSINRSFQLNSPCMSFSQR